MRRHAVTGDENDGKIQKVLLARSWSILMNGYSSEHQFLALAGLLKRTQPLKVALLVLCTAVARR
eukprot:6193463-Pleurochrysis_carterae.AAC.1